MCKFASLFNAGRLPTAAVPAAVPPDDSVRSCNFHGARNRPAVGCLPVWKLAHLLLRRKSLLFFLLVRIESAVFQVPFSYFRLTMLHRILCSTLLLCLFCLSLPLLSGCAKQAGAGSPARGAPPAEVIVDTVKVEDRQIYIYADALTVPSIAVDIRARVPGFLEKLFFKPGAIVRKGAPLAQIERASYEIALMAAKAELANTEAQAELAKANLEREERLLEQRAGTVEAVQTAKANYDMALARIEIAKANIQRAELDLEYTDLRAPITGKATKNLVDVGNYVNPTGLHATILSITQLDPMYVEFKLNDRQFIDLRDRLGFREAYQEATNVPETERTDESSGLPLALIGMPVDVSLMTGVNVFNFDFDIPGKVVALVDDRINFNTAQTTLRAEVRNPLLRTDGAEDYMLYAGKVCRVRLPYETVENAILIREEAIMTDLDTKFVLVVAKGMYQDRGRDGKPAVDENGVEIPPRETNIVYRRDITLGRLLDDQMRIVLRGLESGESYIVYGVQRVRIGSEVTPTPLEEYKARRAAQSP